MFASREPNFKRRVAGHLGGLLGASAMLITVYPTIAGAVPALKKLTLQSVCTFVGGDAVMLVGNENDNDVNYKWEIATTSPSLQGTRVAPFGDSYELFPASTAGNMTLMVGSIHQATKAQNPDQCVAHVEPSKLWLDAAGETIEKHAPVPKGWELTLRSDLETLTCTWNNGQNAVKCHSKVDDEDKHSFGNLDDTLEVPIGGTYSIAETATPGFVRTGLGEQFGPISMPTDLAAFFGGDDTIAVVVTNAEEAVVETTVEETTTTSVEETTTTTEAPATTLAPVEETPTTVEETTTTVEESTSTTGEETTTTAEETTTTTESPATTLAPVEETTTTVEESTSTTAEETTTSVEGSTSTTLAALKITEDTTTTAAPTTAATTTTGQTTTTAAPTEHDASTTAASGATTSEAPPTTLAPPTLARGGEQVLAVAPSLDEAVGPQAMAGVDEAQTLPTTGGAPLPLAVLGAALVAIGGTVALFARRRLAA